MILCDNTSGSLISRKGRHSMIGMSVLEFLVLVLGPIVAYCLAVGGALLELLHMAMTMS